MDKKLFLQSLNSLESAFGEKVSEGRAKIYWDILKGYSDIEIKKAVVRSIRELNFFPKVSEIVGMIEGHPEDEAELAWGYLMEKIEDEGYYHSVLFPRYPVLGAVIVQMAGGWCEFIELFDNDKEKWVKKDFLRIYPIMKRRGNYPDRLIGRFELDNLSKGYTKEIMLKTYGMTLDGKKIDRKLIEDKPKEIIKKE